MEQNLLKQLIVDIAYPPGSIYTTINENMSVETLQTIWGGTWEQIDSVFLLASDNNHALNSTGGNLNASTPAHYHTQSHVHGCDSPAHSVHYMKHNLNCAKGTAYNYLTDYNGTYYSLSPGGNHAHWSNDSSNTILSTTGVSISTYLEESNLPPYIIVYYFRRIT